MSAFFAVALTAAAGLVLPGPGGGPGARRLRALSGPGPAASPRDAPPQLAAERVPAWVPRCALVSAGVLTVTGEGDLAVVAAIAAGLLWWPRHRAFTRRRTRAASLARDLPRTADLLATCLAAGLPSADAVAVVAEVLDDETAGVDPQLRSMVRALGVELVSGRDPGGPGHAPAGRPAGSEESAAYPPWERLTRAVRRAALTGAPLADVLATVAADERERSHWAAEAAARRAGVRAVAPLAACFLPAFVLLGVVPVVAGIAQQVLGGYA
jgi:Flp pilus assembly protein TadB